MELIGREVLAKRTEITRVLIDTHPAVRVARKQPVGNGIIYEGKQNFMIVAPNRAALQPPLFQIIIKGKYIFVRNVGEQRNLTKFLYCLNQLLVPPAP